MTNTISVCIPQALRDEAGDLRINISKFCREALAAEVSRVKEHKAGALSAKIEAPTTTPIGGQGNVTG